MYREHLVTMCHAAPNMPLIDLFPAAEPSGLWELISQKGRSRGMETGKEEQIRVRAYEIWEREGRPQGREYAHWEQARLEIEGNKTGTDATLQPGEAGEVREEAEMRVTAPNGNDAASTPGSVSGVDAMNEVLAPLAPVKRRKSGATRKK
jgi:hypothetical protein